MVSARLAYYVTAAVLSAATIYTAAAVTDAAITPPSNPPPVRSQPCVYTGHSLELLATINTQLTQPVTCSSVFLDDVPTWEALTLPWFLHPQPGATESWGQWGAHPDHTLIVAATMIPHDPDPNWRHAGAAGAYDEQWTRFAETLIDHDLHDVTIRLGHEPNGEWFHHHIGETETDVDAWKAYWNRIAATMKAVPGQQFQFEWSINAGFPAINPDLYYPGNTHVDLIGFSQFDWDHPNGQDPFSDAGLSPDDIAAFAAHNNKPVAIAEYATSNAARGHGDNPAFIATVRSFLDRHPTRYTMYFATDANGIDATLLGQPDTFAAWDTHIVTP